MQSMFYQCRRLEDLNLGSFDTSKLTTINYIFNNCISLKNLDIRNAELSKVRVKLFLTMELRIQQQYMLKIVLKKNI